jgi:hypothetical protein
VSADYTLVWWVDARETALVAMKLAALARPLRLPAGADATPPDIAVAVLDALAHRDGWLVVFDNAESPASLRPWLPSGPGQVLITSVNPAWDALAALVEVDVLPRADAVALLRRRLPDLDDTVADALAEEVGDLRRH